MLCFLFGHRYSVDVFGEKNGISDGKMWCCRCGMKFLPKDER